MRGFLLGLTGALSLAIGLSAMAATPAGLVGVLPAPTSRACRPLPTNGAATANIGCAADMQKTANTAQDTALRSSRHDMTLLPTSVQI